MRADLVCRCTTFPSESHSLCGTRIKKQGCCAGNNFFNTLGNILANGQAALLFIDFQTGDTLHLQGILFTLLRPPVIHQPQHMLRIVLWMDRM